MSRKGSSWVMYLSVRSWLIRCSRGEPLIAGACGKSRGVCGCRPVVRSWSSPRRFPPWVCEALPEIESKLRGRDVYSAWRLQPDLQVGIVHVKSERHLDEILGFGVVGWRRIESGSVRVSTICATRHGRCISPR